MTDNERVELNELCSERVDGTISEARQRRLEKLLLCSEEARRFYVRAMAMSASLFQYAGEMQGEAAEPLNVIRPARWRRLLAPLAAAAVVIAGLLAARFLPVQRADQSGDEAQETVARLSGAKDCKWVGDAPASGDDLTRGRRLELKSGFAEVTFDSGAQLVIEGPASVDLRSEWEAVLHRGSLKANVPPEAAGFRVTNAAVEVVDLGTEFSMTAEEGGAAEVFVLKGAVEVHPRDGHGDLLAKSVLRENQARRFARAGGSEVRDTDRKFRKFVTKIAIDRAVKPLNYVRWSFDEGRGNVASAVSNGQAGGDLLIESAEGGDSHWTAGQWGSALAFDGTFKAKTGISGTTSRNARTVAFWARVPDQAALSDSGPMVTFPISRAGLSWAEISWNRRQGDGAIGAVRVRSDAANHVGTTSVRDGRWHHVAAVFLSSGKSGGRQHLKIYVDGRLEPFSAKSGHRRAAEKPFAGLEGALWLAGRPGTGESFHGAIDELLIADRPLAPQEIRHLMRTNTLMSPEALAAN